MTYFSQIKIKDDDGDLISASNPFPTIDVTLKKVIWDDDTDFDKGTFDSGVEREGTGVDAVVRLKEYTDNNTDVTFTTPGNYSYATDKIDVTGGVAKLFQTVGGENNWTFTTGGNYSYATDKIEVTGGVARLSGDPLSTYGWWHLNESSGTDVVDSSGNGRDGTTQNMEEGDWVSGKLNNCLLFGGSDEYVSFGDIAEFERTDSFSLEAWVKTSSNNMMVVSRSLGASSQRGWSLYIRGTNKIALLLTNSAAGNNYILVEGSTNVADNAWHHVVATYDGSSAASGVTLYVDGSGESENVIKDALSDTIQSVTNCQIGARDGTYMPYTGYIDEVVIYDAELTVDQVGFRYNSGTGTESMPGAYATDDPNIYPNTGYVFGSTLDQFTETATKPEDTGIKYQVSSDDGSTLEWWDGDSWETITGGQTDAWYYTNESNSAADINTNIGSLAGSGTFKFKAFLHTSNDAARPELDNIYVASATTYPIGSFVISMNTDIQPDHVWEYLTTTETVTKPALTDIKYKYSTDGGSDYNGSWLTEPQLESALQGLSPAGGGTDRVRFKFQLTTSDASETPEIDNLNLTSEAGFHASGEYLTNIYDSGNDDSVFDTIHFTVSEPGTSSVLIYGRASNETDDMGSYSSSYTDGDDISLTGRYVQFKATFTGSGNEEADLDLISQNYREDLRSVVDP